MNNPSPFSQLIQQVFRPTPNGVASLVDGLLALCPEHGLQLEWHANQCRVRSIEVEPEESIDLPLPKAVFRAVLARFATLCNERNPGSVSPYRGEGELAVDADPPTVYRVAFTNTPEDQRVQLKRIGKVDRASERRHAEPSGLDGDPRLRTPAAR